LFTYFKAFESIFKRANDHKEGSKMPFKLVLLFVITQCWQNLLFTNDACFSNRAFDCLAGILYTVTPLALGYVSPHNPIGKSATLVISTVWARFPGWPF
jgi:hypothetical protein